MATVIYGVYGTNFDSSGLVLAFFKKEDAEQLIKDIELYEQKNKSPQYQIDWDDDREELYEYIKNMEAYEAHHPLKTMARRYEQYSITEIEVY